MEIVLAPQDLVTVSAILAAAAAIVTMFAKGVRWVDRQKKQDGDISALRDLHNTDMDSMKQEQTLIIYGLLACLKGLKEKGCNGPVSEAINKIEKHLNEKAHE